MKTKITGVLIIHNDCSLLKYALDSAKDLIDELIIVDGAYKWVAPFCKLLGENPEKSTDDLIKIVEDSGIPYKYFSGVWDSETHKRDFSLRQATHDFIMLIDSDELFEINRTELDDFCESGKAIGDCYFPLYFTPDYVGFSTGLKTPPVKAIFLNKRDFSVKSLVDSLFLLVPEGERVERIENQFKYKNKLGTVHHLSLFRADDSGFRRSRFYNLLSMRVSKNLKLFSDDKYENDNQFFNLISSLDEETMESLNNFFEFHRITAAHPNIKSNQYFNHYANSDVYYQNIINNAYQGMIQEQSKLLNKRSNKNYKVINSRPIFIDVTSLHNNITLDSSSAKEFSVVLHSENQGGRYENECKVKAVGEGKLQLIIPEIENISRKVLEIIPKGIGRVLDFKYTLD